MKYYFLMAATLLFMSCGGNTSPADHDHADHQGETPEQHAAHAHEGEDEANHAGHDHATEATEATEATAVKHDHPGGITLSVEQAKELGLEYFDVRPATFTGAIRTSGIIEPSTADNSSVVATSSGVVTHAQTGCNIGTPVSKGSRLFVINSEKLTTDNLSTQIKVAQAELTKAQSSYDRAQSLRKDNLVTADAMEQAQLALTNAKDNYQMLSQSQTITSPQAGYVTSLEVKNGDYVTQGQTLATVSSGKQLVLRADLTARYFDKLNQIHSANFMTPYNGMTYSVSELGGSLLSKGQVTDAGTYAVPVRFSIDNRASLIPGSSVEVYLTTTPLSDVIAIPVSALTEEQGTWYVYLKTCVDTYQKQAVTLGQSNGLQVQILDGVKSGDVVVSRGAYFVRLASMSAAIPHGHSH